MNSLRSQVAALIANTYGDTLAVEMEGHGFLTGAHASRVHAMVVRGISDLLEKTPQADESNQPVAARHAAAFTFELLAQWGKLVSVHEQRPVLGAVPQSSASGPEPAHNDSAREPSNQSPTLGAPDISVFLRAMQLGEPTDNFRLVLGSFIELGKSQQKDYIDAALNALGNAAPEEDNMPAIQFLENATARNQVQNLLVGLGVHSRLEAALLAVRTGPRNRGAARVHTAHD